MIDLRTLDEVNFAVNSKTRYQMPVGQYKWENSDLQGFVGMCADQSIAKWERLFAIGQSKDNMRFTIVGVEEPGDHMILCARVDPASPYWALDIRYPDLQVPANLPYSWLIWGKDFKNNSWTTVAWK